MINYRHSIEVTTNEKNVKIEVHALIVYEHSDLIQNLLFFVQ